MMWTPVLNNVVPVGMFAAYPGLMTAPGRVEDITGEQVRLLGIGTTAGIAVQALALVPFARAAGFRFRPRFDWRGTGLGKSAHAAKWTLLFVLANQVALTVITNHANAADQELPQAGAGYSAYTYARTVWMLPQSIVTVSLVTTLLPRMSRAVAEGRLADLRADLSRALRISGVVIVPAAFLFLVLGPHVSSLLCAAGPAAALGWAVGHVCAGPGGGTWPTAAALTAGTLTTALGHLVLARLMKMKVGGTAPAAVAAEPVTGPGRRRVRRPRGASAEARGRFPRRR